MRGLEIADQPLIEVLALEPRVGTDPLGAVLELGEVVPCRWTRSLTSSDGRREASTPRSHRPSFRDALRQRSRRLRASPERAVEREHRARGGGGVGCELPEIVRGQAVRLEERIAEGLEQIGQQPVLVVPAERLEVEVEGLRQLDQELGRERPPVVLDQVEVARRDPEPLGELAPASGPSDAGRARTWAPSLADSFITTSAEFTDVTA